MATEIELKAHVNNPRELGIRLSQLASFAGTFEKDDIYYYTPQNTSGMTDSLNYGVRVRKQTTTDRNGTVKETTLVTYKSKKVRDGIEVNDEREFEVSPGKAFEEFLGYLGCTEKIRKRKTGRTYDNNGMTVELTEVEGLGWFAELEILTVDKDNETIAREKERLLLFLDRLGISGTSIESRSYAEILNNRETTNS